MTIRLLTVVGARPQFVKAAITSRAISKTDRIAEIIVHTGQHFDPNMSDVFFSELGIPAPSHHLGIGGGTHGQNTGRMIEAIESILLQSRPDIVMVYGDTDSTLAGAVAASKLHIPIAHVEAGLRSFNRRMPEEVNRVLTDHIADLLFVPSSVAAENLAREGINASHVKVVGDVMYDALKVFTPIALRRSSILSDLQLTAKGYVLATVHRKENVDDTERLSAILSGLARSGALVVLPLHPRTAKGIVDHPLGDNIRIVDPVGYFDMMTLEANAIAIATDSGGVQKEAYFHAVPCVTLRDETEWTELIEVGANRLVGADADKIADCLSKPISIPSVLDLYGDGDAADKIAVIIAERYQ